VVAKSLNVCDEVPRGIVGKPESRCGPTTAALIECDDAPLGEIEGFEGSATESAAWTAVKENGRSAVRGPVDFIVDTMSTGHI
jgi:hypothetical protein